MPIFSSERLNYTKMNKELVHDCINEAIKSLKASNTWMYDFSKIAAISYLDSALSFLKD